MTQGSKPKVTQMSFILRFWLEHGHSKVFWRGSVEETGVDGPSRVHVQGGVGIVNFIRESPPPQRAGAPAAVEPARRRTMSGPDEIRMTPSAQFSRGPAPDA